MEQQYFCEGVNGVVGQTKRLKMGWGGRHCKRKADKEEKEKKGKKLEHREKKGK